MSMQQKIIGRSHGGKSIELFTLGTGAKTALIIGGVHGDEPEGFYCVERFLDALKTKEWNIPKGLKLLICPRLNPDGCAKNTRTNDKGVDLNRNLPTQNWEATAKTERYFPGPSAGSEPENKVLVTLLNENKIDLLISFHSYSDAMVNYDGEFSREVAELMSAKNSLPAKPYIGYPTPGSLGTYAAIERKIPTITLEILENQNLQEAWKQHAPALYAALEWVCKQN